MTLRRTSLHKSLAVDKTQQSNKTTKRYLLLLTTSLFWTRWSSSTNNTQQLDFAKHKHGRFASKTAGFLEWRTGLQAPFGRDLCQSIGNVCLDTQQMSPTHLQCKAVCSSCHSNLICMRSSQNTWSRRVPALKLVFHHTLTLRLSLSLRGTKCVKFDLEWQIALILCTFVCWALDYYHLGQPFLLLAVACVCEILLWESTPRSHLVLGVLRFRWLELYLNCLNYLDSFLVFDGRKFAKQNCLDFVQAAKASHYF